MILLIIAVLLGLIGVDVIAELILGGCCKAR
jgi:hypothetical protein